MAQRMELFMSVPRAACFAVTFRVGGSPLGVAARAFTGAEVIDELLDCLQLYTQGQDDKARAD